MSTLLIQYGFVTLVWISGFAAQVILTQSEQVEEHSWETLILGPLGALALSVTIMYILFKYIRILNKDKEKLRNEAKDATDELISELRSQIKKS